MSEIRSALSPKFGDEFDRIFKRPGGIVTPSGQLFAEGKIVQCETCYENAPTCVHTSPHREHGGPCERHGCRPPDQINAGEYPNWR